MLAVYIIIYILSIFFSAFFSSAETSLLSLNKVKLSLKANKKNRKAILLKKILKNPEEFFSTILIGNNFVNIAAASISTVVFTRLITASEELVLLGSTLATTIIILLFAEIIPKSYAFRYSERLSYLYAYPIKFFNYLFYPLVKITSFFSSLIFRKSPSSTEKKELTTEEIKHFLSSETSLLRYNPESLRMINEIIDIAERDIKSIMTPRMNIVALEESAGMDELAQIILGKKISKVPVYRDNLDNITGVIHTARLIPPLMAGELQQLTLKEISVKPIFVSEYSSLHYVLKKFKGHELDIAVVLDEYGAAIGILTINDIFREILGEIEIGPQSIRRAGQNRFLVKGGLPLEEVVSRLGVQLPERKDYTTLSGMFIYYFGKFPKQNSRIKINDLHLTVTRMGKRKIDQLLIELPPKL
jgi:putative hemolysin